VKSGRLDDAERFAWLRLCRSEGIGPLTAAGLLQRFGSASAALAALPGLSRKSGRTVRIAPADDVQRELEAAQRRGLVFLALPEPTYPAALRAIPAAPPVLCIAGDPAILQRAAVAVVGARNASSAGLLFTERLSQGLGAAGYVVASGLARGIDARAHRAALPTGTVAVLAGGHDRLYPPEHEGLAKQIAETGAVISEMPLGWEPRGRDFPRRNRIVSGLSRATVVVEAARRSGSLITARLANEQGREVFAVPGSPLDPRAEGTNDLLRQGATLCTSAADVVDALKPGLSDAVPHSARDNLLPIRRLRDATPLDLNALFEDVDGTEPSDEAFDGPSGEPSDDARVLDLLGPTPTSLDDLVRLSGLTAGQVRAVLTDLELGGEVERRDDGSVFRSSP
jgi:DNA processing protein